MNNVSLQVCDITDVTLLQMRRSKQLSALLMVPQDIPPYKTSSVWYYLVVHCWPVAESNNMEPTEREVWQAFDLLI